MPAPATSLRPARAEDAPALRALVLRAYADYVPQIGGEPRPMTDDYAEVVDRHRVTVAERDGAIVGLVVLAEQDGELWIDNVAVDPPAHGTGAGRALLTHAEDAARADGREELWLLTHELMTRNLDLYARIGYVERRRQPLPGGRCLVHMSKRLSG